jgi:hypothetical protein
VQPIKLKELSRVLVTAQTTMLSQQTDGGAGLGEQDPDTTSE